MRNILAAATGSTIVEPLNPSINRRAAVTRRSIEGLLEIGGTIVPAVAKAFESKLAIEERFAQAFDKRSIN